MKIGFIATVLNEEESISSFLDSLLNQTVKPDVITIVDGDSNDNTASIIKSYKLRFEKNKIKFSLHVKKGNISQGRNYAIYKTDADIIAISDAGCVLSRNWLGRIIAPFKKSEVDVVAGFYKGLPDDNFQKNLIPYVLVMPDKTVGEFLPSGRSMAMRKKVFEELGGFSKNLAQGEDYDFAKRLKKSNANIVFEKNALVSWKPRKNIFSAFKMFYRYAYGDIKAGNIRPKVISIFARYALAILSVLTIRFVSPFAPLYLGVFYFVLYTIWSIFKNYKYIRDISAVYYLPIIQFASDIAVICGTAFSFAVKIIRFVSVFSRGEKLVSLSILIFSILVLSNITWGIPNQNHPFTYHMDEWHQLQSVRNLFTYLTPNMEGSANGPVFHFGLSGIYIGILTVLGFINPFVLSSSLTNLDLQNSMFIYLRFSTFLFALGSIIILIYILKKQLFVKNIYFPLILFLFSPIWISLSNYFKYDIALIFWILVFLAFIFKLRDNFTLRNYLIAGVPLVAAVGTKISALPLYVIYIFAFLIYSKNPFKNLKYPILGTALFIFGFLFFGIPDLILGTGDYFEYFHSNLVRTPPETYNYKLNMPYWAYLFTNQIPTLFGFSAYFFFLISVFYFFKNVIGKNLKLIIRQNTDEIFLLGSFLIFALSLIPMKLFIINRGLVVLPFAVLFIGIIFQKIFVKSKINKKIILSIITIFLVVHFAQGLSWIITKYNDPRENSSEWIKDNIPQKSKIGIESVPIYQFLPDIVLKEYYNNEQDINFEAKYSYEVVNSNSYNLPEYVILTNSDIDAKFVYKSPKKDLYNRIIREGYREVSSFKINRDMNQIFTTRLDFYISLLSPTPNIYVYKK